MKKKLSKYILFPVLLGGTCLVCSCALAGVSFMTHDTIVANAERKFNKAISSIFPQNASQEDVDISGEADLDPSILKVVKVKTAEGKDALAYKLTTVGGYKGPIVFAAGIADFKVVGIRLVNGSGEDGLGVAAFNKFAAAVSTESAYVGDNFDSLTAAAGASAKVTLPLVEAALNAAIADAASRSAEYEVTVEQDSSDIQLFHSKIVSGEAYGNMSADIKVDRKTSAITGLTITPEDAAGENNGYGFKMLDGTAEDAFTTKYVRLPEKGLKFTLFSKAPAAQPDDFFPPEAPITAKNYYSLMYETVKQAKALITEITTVELKAGTTDTYVVDHWDKNSYGNMNADVKLDVANRKVLDVVFNSYSAFPYEGNEFGMDIINKNPNGSNPSLNEFVKKYVVIPDGGLSFDLFLAIDDPLGEPVDTELKTGATYTATGYYVTVQTAVKEALKGAGN